jgi:hypothetical protein
MGPTGWPLELVEGYHFAHDLEQVDREAKERAKAQGTTSPIPNLSKPFVILSSPSNHIKDVVLTGQDPDQAPHREGEVDCRIP